MKGMILDYTGNDAFILLEDDSIITIPLTSFETLIPLGTNISLTNLFNKSASSVYTNVFCDLERFSAGNKIFLIESVCKR